ncbi:MAG: hypothetical protein ABSH08_09965 [Tepidisphaeraceae bacterium]|jgi:hypothetical protein
MRSLIWRLGVGFGFLIATAGCSVSPGTHTKPFDVTVSLDDATAKTNSVEIDLVAVNQNELKRWDNVSVDDYWQPDNALRRTEDKFVMKFDDASNSKTLPVDDPHWAEWQSHTAMYLVAIGYIPGVAASGEGEADPRRQIVTVDAYRWRHNKATELKFEVDSSGIRCITQPDPEEK